MYRLTLDDVNLDKLPEVNLENDSQRHMRQAKDEVADLDDTPEWPSGVDATKREGLAILRYNRHPLGIAAHRRHLDSPVRGFFKYFDLSIRAWCIAIQNLNSKPLRRIIPIGIA